jgi:hypothetical protein
MRDRIKVYLKGILCESAKWVYLRPFELLRQRQYVSSKQREQFAQNTASYTKRPESCICLSQGRIQWWLIATKMSFQFQKKGAEFLDYLNDN